MLKAPRQWALPVPLSCAGPMGFGHSSHFLHTTKILRLSQHLPLVIEIVDNEDKMNAFVDAAIEPHHGERAGHDEKVKVIRYGESGPCEPN